MNKIRICKFYPTTEEDCICEMGSDISGHLPCTTENEALCEWAKEVASDYKLKKGGELNESP